MALPSRHLTRNEGLPTHTVRMTPEGALRVRALAGDIVLFFLARFSRCLSPPRFISSAGGQTVLRWTSILSRGEEKTSFMIQKLG